MILTYGSTRDDARYRFLNKLIFEDVSYPIIRPTINSNEPAESYFDLQITKPFYGRIDYLANASISGINLSNQQVGNLNFNPAQFIKQFNQNTTVSAMNFVVKAFNAFTNDYNSSCVNRKEFSKSSPLSNLTPKVGWINPFEQYIFFLDRIYSRFRDRYFLRDTSKLKTFNDFFLLFSNMLINEINDFSVVFSHYTISRHMSPLSSGLIVEIAEENHSEQIRTYFYSNDSLYDFYVSKASQYGFYIDRNFPWRLIANLSSDKMINNAKSENSKMTDLKKVFDNQFFPSYTHDLYLLRMAFFRAYYQLLIEYKDYKENVGGSLLSFQREGIQEAIDGDTSLLDYLDKKYPESLFLNLYVELTTRFCSQTDNFDPEQTFLEKEQKIKSEIKQKQINTRHIFISKGSKAALNYINYCNRNYGNLLANEKYYINKQFRT